ncbi:hypothetical protein PQC55_gp088 [Escherichia phage vB_EcoP-CHD5UKE1]|uniref:Uncharacterized protein n=1 Tax=Escherichia phage vB_EcoP-CHD5UKE1 TaxID=2865805 RepID=A0ABX9AGF9_9CAUD|nr:hypothetical protein PQC55_gp088 [Escherichia phage vB_EcoP-CHD5UKE1]QZI80584.1 hypothetical protein CHD5UKE1_0088 [Escherichia phage vB_EcoP-CHD5UKE1]
MLEYSEDNIPPVSLVSVKVLRKSSLIKKLFLLSHSSYKMSTRSTPLVKQLTL